MAAVLSPHHPINIQKGSRLRSLVTIADYKIKASHVHSLKGGLPQLVSSQFSVYRVLSKQKHSLKLERLSFKLPNAQHSYQILKVIYQMFEKV